MTLSAHYPQDISKDMYLSQCLLLLGIFASHATSDFIFNNPPAVATGDAAISFDISSLVNISWSTDYSSYTVHLLQSISNPDGTDNSSNIVIYGKNKPLE